GVLPPDASWAPSRSNRQRLAGLQARYGVQVTPVKPPLLEAASIVVLAVKLKDTQEVLDQITGTVRGEQLVISVIAGIPLATLERALRGIPVIRAKIGRAHV